MESQMRLEMYGRRAKAHWEEHRPRMVAHLKKMGVYLDALVNAQNLARDQIARLVSDQGMEINQAKELVLNDLVFLPTEEEEPILPPDRMPFSQPEPTIA